MVAPDGRKKRQPTQTNQETRDEWADSQQPPNRRTHDTTSATTELVAHRYTTVFPRALVTSVHAHWEMEGGSINYALNMLIPPMHRSGAVVLFFYTRF